MINKEMTILEIVEKYPETQKIFSEYDEFINKCVLCHCLFDTIASLATNYDIDIGVLLDKINNLIYN